MEREGQIVCSSCGVLLVTPMGAGVRPWGHAHNMPVKHFPHLEADPKNFSPRCQNWQGREGCHEKLDTPNFREIVKFKDFDSLMRYRFEHDKLAYNRWVSALNDLGINEGWPYADIS